MITSFEAGSLPPAPENGSVLSLGVFDGVHLGHQAIFEDNLAAARARGAVSTIVTFRRHPKRVLLGREPRMLTSLEHRLELFARAGIEHTIVLSFDRPLMETPAAEFARSFLVERLGGVAFVLGFDSKFGRGREGTPALLEGLGYDVQVVDKVLVADRAVSSTAIREAVELGDLEAARAMLGRPVSVFGTVVHGRGIGRELGFPTANLNLHHELHPPQGVYAVRARRVARKGHEGEGRLHAVANIGSRPTVTGSPAQEPTIEVHLMDFEGDLYGASFELEFIARLRGERRFESLDALRDQIARDIEGAREVLAGL